MASQAHLLAVLLCITTGVERTWGACNPASLGVQMDGMLAEYDRAAAPAQKVSIQLALDVRHAAVDDYSATLHLLADLHMSWQDPRLTWNETEWGCDWALVAAERLWLPDVGLQSAAVTGAGSEPLRARLSSTGAVAWASRLDATLSLALRLVAWPEDIQIAVVKFASRAHSIEEIDLVIQDGQHATLFEAGAWEIVSLSGAVNRSAAADGSTRRTAAWTLTLRRRAPAQAMLARVLLAATLLMLLAAALLPPQNRAPLSAAAAFTITLWLCVAASRAGSGAPAPRLVVCGGALCVAAALGAAGAALAARAKSLALPPPHAVRAALIAAGKYLPFVIDGEGAGESGTWTAAAQLLDAVLQTALGFAVLIILCIYL